MKNCKILVLKSVIKRKKVPTVFGEKSWFHIIWSKYYDCTITVSNPYVSLYKTSLNFGSEIFFNF